MKEDFIQKAKQKHGDKYEYTHVEYVNTKTKVKIICKEHGEFWQTPAHHLKGTSPCPVCNENRKRITAQDYIKRAKDIHGDKYDYSKTKYTKMAEKVVITCKTHGDFLMKAQNHISSLKQGCPKCRIKRIKDTVRVKQSKSIINKFKQIHDDKYDYSEVEYVNTKTKVKIICKEHGSFWQTPNHHLKGQGCPECGSKYKWENTTRRVTKEEFIERSNLIHENKYDYSLVEFGGMNNKVEIVCPTHGEFYQMPHNHLYLGDNCPKCANTTSSHELFIEEILNKYNIRYSSRDKTVIPPLELDFYIPEQNIGIEVNGVYWHSELRGKDKNYHLTKTKLCEERGVRLIHINENECLNNRKTVESKLRSIFKTGKLRIYARNCEVKEVDSKTKSKFLDKYHIQGNDKSNVYLGLFYRGRMVSIMTFSKYRLGIGDGLQVEGGWELSRFCNNYNSNIIGGAGKLLKYFEKTYTPKQIKTYADKRWSDGNLYFKLGFEHTHDSKPSYWYFKTKDKLYHRFNFRKSELPKKLETFDPQKTEWENMVDNGWNRIWDCGTMVFVKNYK